ncbi:Gpr1 family protein [Clavulina sp. PMI_390]|nr:Gpr1 family protein [Clavulina sp. PMI_390]
MADLEKNTSATPVGNAMTLDGGRSPHLRVIANPAPLGLFSFASTTLILSLVNVQARHVTEPNVVVGMAVACGGLAQLLAGQWEFVTGNTFGATAFSSYGAFWISYALILIPGTGVLDAYTGADAKPGDLDNALAFYLTSWFIFTFIMWLASLRSTLATSAVFFFLWITFMLLAIGNYKASVNVIKAGGGFGLLTAACAYYVAASDVITPKTSYAALPVMHLPKRNDL